MNRSFSFSAFLSVEQCHEYYQGLIKYVQVTADSGERIRFSFRHIQPFMTSMGIKGRFRLTVTEKGEFQLLEKIN